MQVSGCEGRQREIKGKICNQLGPCRVCTSRLIWVAQAQAKESCCHPEARNVFSNIADRPVGEFQGRGPNWDVGTAGDPV